MHSPSVAKQRLKEKIKDKSKIFLEGFKEKYRYNDIQCIHSYMLMGWDNKVKKYIANVKAYQLIYNAKYPTEPVDGLFLALTEPYEGDNTDIVGMVPLILAMSENNTAIIRLLLSNVNIANRIVKAKEGIIAAPIIIAIGSAIQNSVCLAMVDVLLEYQADPNTIDDKNQMPILGVCVSNNFIAGAERLIAKGALLFEITEGKYKGETIFSLAIKYAEFPMIRLLAKKFAQQIKSEIDQCKTIQGIKESAGDMFYPLVMDSIKEIKGPVNVDELKQKKLLQPTSNVTEQYSYMMLLTKKLPLAELLEIFTELQIDIKQFPSCLFWSVAANQQDKIKYLLEQGVDPYFTMPANSGVDGYNLLMAACMGNVLPPMINLIKSCKELIYQRAPIGHYKGLIALEVAILNNQLLAMQYLAKLPYELSHIKSLSGDDSILKSVVSSIAINNNMQKFSPIFDLIKSLADKPENSEEINTLCACAVHYAMIYGLGEVFEKLLPFVTNVNKTYQSADVIYRLIQPAILSNNIAFVDKLIQKGMELDYFIGQKKVPLIMVLVTRRNHAFLKFFLDKNIDVKSMDPQTGLYPLELAFLSHDIECISLLLQYGAELNKEYRKLNGSPLTYLVVSDYPQYIKDLLERGADPHYVNKEGNYAGKSPWQIALANSNDNPEILVPFLEHFKIIRAIIEDFKQGSSIIYAALKHNDPALVNDLLHNGVNLNQVNDDGVDRGDLPLALVIRNNKEALTQALLAAGADADAKIKRDRTRLTCKDLAINIANPLILEVLNLSSSAITRPESQQTQIDQTEAIASSIFIEPVVELSQVNPEVYYHHCYALKKTSIFLYHARYELEQLSKNINSIRSTNTEYKQRKLLYLLTIDLLRAFEALMRYALDENTNNIMSAKLASEIRNIIMHVFCKLDLKYFMSFAQLCLSELLPAVQQYILKPTVLEINLDEHFKKSDFYKIYQPILIANAESHLTQDQIIKFIIETLQFLQKNAENVDDKFSFRTSPSTVRIVCMALSMIGQYQRLLKENNVNFESVFASNISDKNEMFGFIAFLNRCSHLRGIVAHEFTDKIPKNEMILVADSVGDLSLFKMLSSAKRYSRHFENEHYVQLSTALQRTQTN